jgi:hypothetical protein
MPNGIDKNDVRLAIACGLSGETRDVAYRGSGGTDRHVGLWTVEPATRTYGTGKRAVEINDVYAVEVRRTRDGARETKTIHLALVDRQLRWFSNC